MAALGFYDHDRQPYADTQPSREDGEFMVGGYVGSGGVDKRGEFAIILYRFSHHDGSYIYGRMVPDETLTPQLRVFHDAYGALQDAIGLGLLDALANATLRTRDDLSRLLIGLGMRDRSERPMEKVSA